jgi:hypothetical protein
MSINVTSSNDAEQAAAVHDSGSCEEADVLDPITLYPIPADKVFALSDMDDNGKVHHTTFDISSLKTILFVARNEKPRPVVPRHPITGKPFTDTQLRAIDDHHAPTVSAEFEQVHANANALRVHEAQLEEKSEFLEDLLTFRLASGNGNIHNSVDSEKEPTDLVHEMSIEHGHCVDTVLKYVFHVHASHPNMQKCREMVIQRHLSLKDLGLMFLNIRLECQSQTDRHAARQYQYNVEDFLMTMLLLRGCAQRIVHVFKRLLNAPLHYAFQNVLDCITQCHDGHSNQLESLLLTWVNYLRLVHTSSLSARMLATSFFALEEARCINTRTVSILLTMSDWSLNMTQHLICSSNLSAPTVCRIMRLYNLSDLHRKTLMQTIISVLKNFHACMKSNPAQFFSMRGHRVFMNVSKFEMYFTQYVSSSRMGCNADSHDALYAITRECYTYAEQELSTYIQEKAMPRDAPHILKFQARFMNCLRLLLNAHAHVATPACAHHSSHKRTHREINADQQESVSSHDVTQTSSAAAPKRPKHSPNTE